MPDQPSDPTTKVPLDVTECPDCQQTGVYEARVLINGRGFYTCPAGHRWQDIREKPSDKGLPIRGAAHDRDD